MSNTTSATKTSELYESITTRFIEQLEQGTVPWRMPWLTREHRNARRGNVYRGINRVLLAMAAEAAAAEGREFTHLWLTEKQAARLGGRVRTGEQPTTVVLWRPITKAVEDEVTHEVKVRTVWLVRASNVWNLAQTEGCRVPAKRQAELDGYAAEQADCDEAAAEALWASWGDKPREVEASAAWYQPKADLMGVPAKSLFASVEHYWATRYHEAVHSTGHASRLNRPGVTKSDGFGGEAYSAEELVAEMGAAFLCARSGMLTDSTFENSAAYLAGWLAAIKADPKMVITAAQQAEKAARHIAPEAGDHEAAECTALVHVPSAPLVVQAA